MQGYTGVIFFGMETNVANAENRYWVAQCATSGGTYVDLAGSSFRPDTANDCGAIDIYRPTDRFVRVEGSTDSSSFVGAIFALLYGGIRKGPVDDDTAINDGTKIVLISPAEDAASEGE